MSAIKNLRKGPKKNYSEAVELSGKRMRNETLEHERRATEFKRPVSLSNNQMYPCQHCDKNFPQKLSSITHMKKCHQKFKTTPVLNESKFGINNNDVNQTKTDEDCNNKGSNNENKPTQTKNNVAEKVTHDTSIYDYNEQDDNLEEKDLKENNEETFHNKNCKHCKTLFDNPLDLLRHTRDCHHFPRTVLPPDEIEKYFDYPNREFCPICEKPIKTRNFRSVFIKHLLVHTSGHAHECRVCKKKFRRRDHMRAHEKRHIVPV